MVVLLKIVFQQTVVRVIIKQLALEFIGSFKYLGGDLKKSIGVLSIKDKT